MRKRASALRSMWGWPVSATVRWIVCRSVRSRSSAHEQPKLYRHRIFAASGTCVDACGYVSGAFTDDAGQRTQISAYPAFTFTKPLRDSQPKHGRRRPQHDRVHPGPLRLVRNKSTRGFLEQYRKTQFKLLFDPESIEFLPRDRDSNRSGLTAVVLQLFISNMPSRAP